MLGKVKRRRFLLPKVSIDHMAGKAKTNCECISSDTPRLPTRSCLR